MSASPIIICPYVSESDLEQARRAFLLDAPTGQHLPFFFWKDELGVGPERAYEHCWKQFPERDVIIIHTDMAPMPDDQSNQWFGDLLKFVSELPQAGMVACDLLYPLRTSDGSWLVQCAGGYFEDREIRYIGGGVDVESGAISTAARVYDDTLKKVRAVPWVTFGGLYIRREVLDTCGGFDQRYQWAYVMDVDYCLEARMRGFELFQVPVNLTHFEARSTRTVRTPERQSQVEKNYQAFNSKWGWWLGVDPLRSPAYR